LAPAGESPHKRRKEAGDSGIAALRILKRRLSDVIYAALRADLALNAKPLAA
jgi:transposase